ncbi:hypothetical protein KDD17_03760 [Sulfitobacter albidus]|uniref:EF-hand domain-containing protein n=1 Tax=Sulfitobacter albidus TaxID=2829501 RepID=A0A975JER5_9RHOB|nr:hypothetical protein [Sulfitobacter albidus]QUJ77152.1 hypothetical protein KDD17_03760 [Sulfitobacter albidus]
MAMKYVLFSLMMCALPVAAQDRDSLIAVLETRIPGATLKDLRADPDRFLTEAAGVVLGFGGPAGIDADGIEAAIAAERARVRARELRRLLEADLNDDLAVSTAEMAVVIGAASATMRGRLMGWHLDADRDGDGTASWAELRAFGRARARAALGAEDAQALRRLMIFDTDADGRVTVAELRRAIALLNPPG